MTAFSRAIEAFNRGDLKSARDIAEQANRKAPSPRWSHMLGLIECRSGKPAAGVPHLKVAAEGEPDNVGFQVILARALVDSGRPQEVLSMEEPPKIASAEVLALWQARAEAANAAKNDGEAVRAWRTIAVARGNDHRAWTNLARACLKIELFDDGEKAYRQALAAAPRDVEVLHELALLYERIGRLEAMAALLESAEQAGIAKNRLAFAWATLEQRRGRAEDALKLLAEGDAASDAIRWYRLKSRIQDSLGNSPEAFEAATAMNRASPAFDEWRRGGLRYREQLRSFAEAITQSWATTLPVLPAMAEAPVFLVGFPRSGTTLLDTFLMGHPQIMVIEERPLLFNSTQPIGSMDSLTNADPGELRQMRETYLRLLGDEAGGSASETIVDKFPLNMVAAPLIHCLFPGARMLFVKRHPCDSVLSGFMQAFVANLGMASFLDIEDAGDFYDACMTVWAASAEELPLNTHSVCYEELVAEPEATLRPVIEFLGLRWDDRLLDHQRTARLRGPIPNTSYDQVTQPLTESPVYRWRRYREQLEPVLPRLLPWAERLGYGNDA
jgi:Flp pilus assembly protein TadD